MFCQHCGAPASESFRFCPECGGRRQGRLSFFHHHRTWDPLTIAVVALTAMLVGATALGLPNKHQVVASDPSEADTRVVFEHQRPEFQTGAAKLLTFRKVSAESQEIVGVIVHFAEYEAEIAYPARSETETLSGQITFKLTEKGWLGEDGELY